MQPLEPLSNTKKDAADAPPTTPVRLAKFQPDSAFSMSSMFRPTPAGKKRVKVITLEE